MNYPPRKNVYIVLLHHPVYNKRGDVITSAVTNLDIHDIARVVCTYGLGGYFIVTPVKNQFRLLQEVIEFWRHGVGQEYNPTRSQSFDNVMGVPHLADVRRAIGKDALWLVTTARQYENCMSLTDVQNWSEAHPKRNIAILFGTGFGLTDEYINSFEHILCPIDGGTGYNHLSVRSAVSIIVDRLFRT